MKRELKTELTKQKILLAAMREFGEKGYYAASLNTVCDTGISKGLLYHNFKNKDAVYLACAERCFHDMTEYLKEHCRDVEPQEYMNARLHFFEENEISARLFFEVLLNPPAHLKEQIQKVKMEFDELNYSVYRKILSSLTLRPGITQEDAVEYFLMMQNMFNACFESPVLCGTSFSDRIAAHETGVSRVLDFMLYGIAERKR